MPQFQAYCNEDELKEYHELDRETKERINKQTRKYWYGLIKAAKKKG